MKSDYSKLEESQGHRDRGLISAGYVSSTREEKFRKLWPWTTVLATLAVISILSLTQLGPVVKQGIKHCFVSIKFAAQGPQQEKVISCYYNTPNRNDSSRAPQLLPADIQPHLCTHINIAFARVLNKSIYLEHSQYNDMLEVLKLKLKNPMLKVLLSVGGAGQSNGFSEMVIDHASRKIFIKSIKKILKDYKLDGIDLDWEFPVLHEGGLSARERQHFSQHEGGLSARERQHFSQLLREIKMEFIREKKDYILSVAIAAPQTIVDVAYDVDQINLYVDFANIMTYDFHFYTKFTPFTGFNSPLYAKSTEELFLATLNINYTIHLYQSKGLDRNKMVVGVPTYGHSFKLVNEENPGVGSPASGFGSVGGGGFVDYPAVCAFEKQHAGDVTLRWDREACAPYLYRGVEWLSYETPRSVMEKATFIKANNLRGAMIYSLNADDYRGRCARSGDEPEPFPLARSVAGALRAPGP